MMYIARQEDGKKIFVTGIDDVIRLDPVVKRKARVWRFQGLAEKSMKTYGVAAIDETESAARLRIYEFRADA
jgi:hypothetical protein